MLVEIFFLVVSIDLFCPFFMPFLYNGVYWGHLVLSIYDIIVSQKLYILSFVLGLGENLTKPIFLQNFVSIFKLFLAFLHERCWKSILRPLLGVVFFMLALLRRTSFLTTFYGLYFSHHCTHITNYNLFTCWTSVGSFHVLHLHLPFWLVGTLHACASVSMCPWISYRHKQSFNLLIPITRL